MSTEPLHLVRLKMKPNKKHICLLFCFHKKKSVADAHRIIVIICKTYKCSH